MKSVETRGYRVPVLLASDAKQVETVSKFFTLGELDDPAPIKRCWECGSAAHFKWGCPHTTTEPAAGVPGGTVAGALGAPGASRGAATGTHGGALAGALEQERLEFQQSRLPRPRRPQTVRCGLSTWMRLRQWDQGVVFPSLSTGFWGERAFLFV